MNSVAMELLTLLFLFLLLIVAMLYASIGHGGASGYLALMGLFAMDTYYMKGSALLLNIFVSAFAFYQYWRGGYFRWKLFLPFAIASIPMAFLGGTIDLDPVVYKRILGICLLFAVARLSGLVGREMGKPREVNYLLSVCIGLLLGLFSGLIGIGGGIILSPIILLFGWANMKETAAISALFIFVNSIAGISGLALDGLNLHPMIFVWVAVAFLGGSIGAYGAAKKLDNLTLKYVLSAVLFIASIKLIFI
jgi:hypothetical protein